jgi:alkaline phosphatase
MVQSGFDFFGGGGFKEPTGRLGQHDHIYETARAEGYTIIDSKEDFLALRRGSGKIIAVNEDLTYDFAMSYEIDRRSDDITLAQYVRKAIELLDNENGFFILAEAGKIDWACHDNDAYTAIKEVLALDEAVHEAIRFYQAHPEETLIVVTADHETGGMSLGSTRAGYRTAYEMLDVQNISMDEFKEQYLKPYRSLTDDEEQSVSDMLPRIDKHLGLVRLSPEDNEELWERIEEENSEGLQTLKLSLSPLEMKELDEALQDIHPDLFYLTLIRNLNERAGISWTSDSHTAIPIPVFALGAGSSLFSGYFDNTDIAKNIARLLGVDMKNE